MSEKMVSVSEEQFLMTVDKWMYLAGEIEEPILVCCGFCAALDEAREEDEDLSCENCYCFEEKLCASEDSVYEHWCWAQFRSSKQDKRQAALEMLEGLYRLGVKLGFYAEEEIIFE